MFWQICVKVNSSLLASFWQKRLWGVSTSTFWFHLWRFLLQSKSQVPKPGKVFPQFSAKRTFLHFLTLLKLRSLLKLLLRVIFLLKSLLLLFTTTPSFSSPLFLTRTTRPPLTTSPSSPPCSESSSTLSSVWVPLSRCSLTKVFVWKQYFRQAP